MFLAHVPIHAARILVFSAGAGDSVSNLAAGIVRLGHVFQKRERLRIKLGRRDEVVRKGPPRGRIHEGTRFAVGLAAGGGKSAEIPLQNGGCRHETDGLRRRGSRARALISEKEEQL